MILPGKQLVADTIKSERASTWSEYTTYAKENRPYISMNNPEVDKCSFLMIDCDHDNYDEFPGDFPLPTVTVITAETGRHHHIWELAAPVLTGGNSRLPPRRLLSAVERGFVWHLDGDKSYTNRLTKNPFYNPANRINDKVYQNAPYNDPLKAGWHKIWYKDSEPINLKEVSIWCEDEDTSYRSFKRDRSYIPQAFGYGRNVEIFDQTRYWAYDNWVGNRIEIHNTAQSFNLNLDVPLGRREVEQTATSICKFMEEKYTGKRIKIAPLKERRFPIVKQAVEQLFIELKRFPNVREIGRLTGISERSVKHVLEHFYGNNLPEKSL